jgi:3-hydroxyisobutyrate dehydrogenase-like beta-hydroxyacid dehydrogenase
MNVGFIGLGKMGAAIASNLLRAGNQLTVYNRSAEKTEPLAKEGAQVAKTPAEAATRSEAIFTMLADDQAVAAVVLGENGVASGMGKNSVHISSSTISVPFARLLAEEHTRRGQAFLSAPVFGRPEAAAAKKLLVVAAGDQATVERLQPLFDAIGRRTFFAGGEPWHANAFKLCGNFMICSAIETFSEAFTTLRKAGLAHKEFLEIMVELFGSPVYQNYGTALANRAFEPAGFGLRLGLKDIRQVLEFAQELHAPMPLASLMCDHLSAAMANGYQDSDWTAVQRVLERNAGL